MYTYDIFLFVYFEKEGSNFYTTANHVSFSTFVVGNAHVRIIYTDIN